MLISFRRHLGPVFLAGALALAAPAAWGDAWPDDPLDTAAAGHGSFAPCMEAKPPEGPLRLADAVSLALCHNPQTRESWANRLAAAAKLGSARAAYLPTVSADAGLQRNMNRVSGIHTASTRFSPSVSLDYLLYDFGAREANNETTRQNLLALDYTHNATLQNVMFAAVQDYNRLYATLGVVDALDEALRAAQASVDAASLRHKVGAGTLADQLLAETTYAQTALKREQARNDVHAARGALANALGLPPDTALTLPDAAPEELNADFAGGISSLLAEAKARRPDLAADAAQLQASRANIDLERAGGLPSISFGASQGYDVAVANERGTDRATAVGVSVHIPLFTGFDRTYRIRAAERAAEAQEARNHSDEDAALLDVWTSWGNLDTARATRSMTESLFASALKSEEVALGRYKAGAGTITDLLNAQTQLADARQQRVAAQYNWLIAKADLLRAAGRIDGAALDKTGDRTGTAK